MRAVNFRQVDVSGKPVSFRSATASGVLKLRPRTVKITKEGKAEKGDPLILAEITAIAATKLTPTLLPLCHPLRIESTRVTTRLLPSGVEATVTVTAHEKTGVEMEALMGVSVALLNIWDVVKPYEKDKGGQYPTTVMQSVRVIKKVKRPIETS
jgi:cyclic pyranopterin phosphate synthase